jgi:hypothetical protein
MDTELKAKIKAKLNVTVQAVQGMMQPDIDDEEKQGWIAIYNGAMRKIMNEYLADEVPSQAPAEEPVEGEAAVDVSDIPEDVGGITNAE